jgi:glutamate racemase
MERGTENEVAPLLLCITRSGEGLDLAAVATTLMNMKLAALLATWMVTISSAMADAVRQSVADQLPANPQHYAGDLSQLPIGVFDSGIGGLTVLEAILKLDAFHNDSLQPGADGRPDFENERFIYLGDQANMPYGNYSAVGRTDFLRELILRDAAFLVGSRYHEGGREMQDKPPVKAIVIACNTATAYGLEDIRALLAQWQLPVLVVGVVEAGARGVTESLPREMGVTGVGVLATVGTCKSGAYPKAIARSSGQAGKSPPIVIQQGCVALAGAIEGDPAFLQDGATVESHLQKDVLDMVEAHRQSGAEVPLQRVVLGCTHFPLVGERILAALAEVRQRPEYARLVAEQVQLIDPAELTAKELFRELARAQIRQKAPARESHRFFISVPNPSDPSARLTADGTRLDRDYQYGRAPGHPARQDTLVVPMNPKDLPTPALSLLENHLPRVWREMR